MTIREMINELHLYNNKIEALMRVLGWVASWIGGILAIMLDSKTLFSSAFFIFSMSLLMEFAPKIEKIENRICKVIYTLFCFAIAMIWVIALIGLFTKIDDNVVLNTFMFIISIIIVVYMIVDCVILWIFGVGKNNNTTPPAKENDDESIKAEKLYNKNLSSGQLGRIEEE